MQRSDQGFWLIRSALQLSKEEEGAGDEAEVRREDQDKINKFSQLHQKELKLEEALKAKNVSPPRGPPLSPAQLFVLTIGCLQQKEKEELEDVTTELELADEDDLVP